MGMRDHGMVGGNMWNNCSSSKTNRIIWQVAPIITGTLNFHIQKLLFPPVLQEF